MKGQKTVWTEEMNQKIIDEFPFRITIDIASEMNLSIRTLIRKARELGIEKEDGFLDKNRGEISRRATEKKPPNPMKGVNGFIIPNSEQYRFKKGERKHIPDYEKIRAKRNETIRSEKIRIKYGLKQKTKLKLINIY